MQLNQSKCKSLEKELNKLSEVRESKWTIENEERRQEILLEVERLEDINSELPLEIVKSLCDGIVSFFNFYFFNGFRLPCFSWTTSISLNG